MGLEPSQHHATFLKLIDASGVGPEPFPLVLTIMTLRITDQLCPAVLPAEQDMREVGLPAVEDGAEPGGSDTRSYLGVGERGAPARVRLRGNGERTGPWRR
jgi:hypothetical protein